MSKDITNILLAILIFLCGYFFALPCEETQEERKVLWDTVVFVSVHRDEHLVDLIRKQGFSHEEALSLAEHFREFNCLPSLTVKAGSKIRLPISNKKF